MDGPGREQLAEGHRAELGMDAAQLELVAT